MWGLLQLTLAWKKTVNATFFFGSNLILFSPSSGDQVCRVIRLPEPLSQEPRPLAPTSCRLHPTSRSTSQECSLYNHLQFWPHMLHLQTVPGQQECGLRMMSRHFMWCVFVFLFMFVFCFCFCLCFCCEKNKTTWYCSSCCSECTPATVSSCTIFHP